MHLPDRPDPTTVTALKNLEKFDTVISHTLMSGVCDTTWASYHLQRHSIGGIGLILAGAAIYYRTRLQLTIAQSFTEAEFTNMADAGKAALYILWILGELGIIQDIANPIIAENRGDINMAQAHQPTRLHCLSSWRKL